MANETELTLGDVAKGTYELAYGHLTGPAKVSKALRELVNYLGWDKFTLISIGAQATEATWDDFQEVVASHGVRGYPVAAWWLVLTGDEITSNGEFDWNVWKGVG